MKKTTWLILFTFILMTTGCAYEKAYQSYTNAQAEIAKNSGPLIELHTNGQLKSVGNPMLAMMGMQMKAPRSDWDGFWDVLKVAIPLGAIWGIVGTMSTNLGSGSTTNVSGGGNFVGNTAGDNASWASPVTTTTTFLPPTPVAE